MFRFMFEQLQSLQGDAVNMDNIIVDRRPADLEADCYCDKCGEGWTEEMIPGKALIRYSLEVWHQEHSPDCYSG